MSITTMVLKRVAELNDGRIGLDDYPIFDEGYRDTLNTKIFDRYMNREIGQETDSLFIHMMGRRMREIMPYYNQLYESEKLVIDPFNNINVANTSTSDTGSNSTTTGEGTSSTDRGTSDEGETTTDTTTNVEGTSSTDVTEDSESSNDSSNASDSKSRAMGSQTPQVRLSPDADYADSITDSWSENSSTGEATDTRTGSSSETGTTTDETTTNETGTTSSSGTSSETGATTDESEANSTTSVADDAHRRGFEGSQVDMLKNLRSSFLNIDLQVLDELEDLFMLTWFNDDYYTDHNSLLYGRVL